MNTPFKIIISIFIIILIQVNITYAQWIKSTIIGGHSNVLSLSLRNDTVFVFTDAGVYFSTDSGDHWILYGTNVGSASSLVISGNNMFEGVYNSGVFLSTNRGMDWTSISNGLTNPRVMALTMNGSNLLAGTVRCTGRYCDNIPGGLYISTDNGVSWNSSGLTGLDVNIFYTNDTRLYAGTSNGVYVSSNNGTTWDSINIGLINISITAIAVSSTNIFAGDLYNNIYLSTNNGISWNKVSTLPPDTINYTNSIHTLLTRGNNLYAGTGSGVHLSTNNGTAWTDLNSGLTNLNISSLISKDTILYVGTSGRGVFTLNNNSPMWNLKSTGISGINETYTFINIGNRLFIGTYGDGVFQSTDAGITWYSENLSPAYSTSFAFNGSNLIAGSPNGLFLSEDTCASWENAYNGSWIDANTASRILGVIGNNFYASFNNGFFISTDGGINWTPSSYWGQYGAWIKAFAYSGTNMFAGTWGGVYLSTDNGTNWIAINNGISNTYGLEINTLAVNGNNIYLGAWGVGMYISTNNGLSWNEINNGLSNLFVQSIAVKGSDVFVGTLNGGGVFHSSDNGSSWKAINTGLSVLDIYSLFIYNNNIYAGSSSGIFSRSLSEVTIVEKENSKIPKQFSLFQNYPNPFNPTTHIDFDIPTTSFTTLEIFDLLGRNVGSLVAEVLQPGHYTKLWNAIGYSSGVYFYSLQSGCNRTIKKLLLLK